MVTYYMAAYEECCRDSCKVDDDNESIFIKIKTLDHEFRNGDCVN